MRRTRCRTRRALTALQTKAHLGDVGRDIARMATEAHGGMGFTDLLGLHYWFKRISFNRQMLGRARTLPRGSRATCKGGSGSCST